MIKPRIFWRYYPRFRRGYWCVSPTPFPASPQVRQLWRYAHEMKGQMNAAPLTATQAAEARDKFNEAYPRVKSWWDGVMDQHKPTAGCRDDLDLSERASREPNDPRRAPK